MLVKVKGIVLKTTRYSESSVVAQIFTDKLGMQSYLINGVRKPKAKISMNMLQPLHLLDMVVSQKGNMQLQRVSEAKPSPMFKSIPYDVVKNSIAQFLNEVVYKCVHQQQSDEELFEFLYHAISWFDEAEGHLPNFHLAFLAKLTKFLGFAPKADYRHDQKYFDLQEGEFTSVMPLHPHFIDEQGAQYMVGLFATPFQDVNKIVISYAGRKWLLEKLLVYYGLHVVSFGNVKSHQVLEQVLG